MEVVGAEGGGGAGSERTGRDSTTTGCGARCGASTRSTARGGGGSYRGAENCLGAGAGAASWGMLMPLPWFWTGVCTADPGLSVLTWRCTEKGAPAGLWGVWEGVEFGDERIGRTVACWPWVKAVVSAFACLLEANEGASLLLGAADGVFCTV